MRPFQLKPLVLASIISLMLIPLATTAQKVFFSQPVSEGQLQAGEAVPEGLRRNYFSTTYFREVAFIPGPDFKISIPGKGILRVNQNKWSYHQNSFSFIGSINGSENSSVVFSKALNRWHGMITTDDLQRYVIQQTSDNIFAVSQVNETSYIDQDSHNDVSTPQEDIAVNPNVCDAVNSCVADPVIINIMVVYTEAAAIELGGEGAMVAAMTTAVSNMNIANLNSGVNASIQFNLVHTAQVTYTESGNSGTDLGRLANDSDGFMDNVQLLRLVHQADLVSLIVATPTSTCGLGYLNTNPANYSSNAAYNVVVYNCAVSNFTLAHELGHNMGLRHDRYVDNSNTPCAHHHGYVNQDAFLVGAPSNTRWRTILAYNDQCSDNGFNCSRVNHWANPAVLRNTDPMGIPVSEINSADEVYGINRFACVVASFQGLSVVPMKFVSVTAGYERNQLVINWKTANEINVEKYEVEIANGLPENFSKISTVAAKNLSLNQYQLRSTVQPADDVFIRIKGIDNDGRIYYSSIVFLKDIPPHSGFSAVVLGNPASHQLRISLNSLNIHPVAIKIISLEGRVVSHSRFTQVSEGRNIFSINTSRLADGIYIASIEQNGITKNIKFIRN